MKKKLYAALCIVMVAVAAVVLICATSGDDTMTKKNGVYIVNTTKLGANVQGYNGPTPLKIYIKEDKIEKVEALPNDETPRFFEMVKTGLLNKWNGMTVKQAASAKVDAVTGATYSSNAVKENVRLGVEYYQKHKK
ncbi:MAG: FMN-binding protein [Bacteroidales bacterium]|jgi:electron transport complex protein RnfG|nr:FMN-binding protein [Bacteroidales bacterium]